MSSKKAPIPYMIQVPTAEAASLLVELFQKAVIPAPQAHVLAGLWSQIERCAAHFAPPEPKKSEP